MVMSTERLRSHLEPLLSVDTVRTIRIGTKSVAYWPQRFVTDPDADDVLRLFEKVVASGRNLAVMAHFSHPRELGTDLARRAIARIRSTGALVYCQAPLIARVNDDPDVWSRMWRAELAAGSVPYYMFVERDTGPYDYFRVPLARAAEIFQSAYRTLPGLARTVRGPVMSATPGKVAVDGVVENAEGRFFQLQMVQARDPSWSVGPSWRTSTPRPPGWTNCGSTAPYRPTSRVRSPDRRGRARRSSSGPRRPHRWGARHERHADVTEPGPQPAGGTAPGGRRAADPPRLRGVQTPRVRAAGGTARRRGDPQRLRAGGLLRPRSGAPPRGTSTAAASPPTPTRSWSPRAANRC